MAYRRYLVEFGMGADLHGLDVSKAAGRAVKDAISHCCLCGMEELLGIQDPNRAMKVHIRVGCPNPEKVETEALAALIPFGSPQVEVVHGGLSVRGLAVPSLGDGDNIVLANAALTVWVDTDMVCI